MKIALVNTYDIMGGAAIACHRLFQGLRESGADCRLVVKNKKSANDSVICVTPEQNDDELADIAQAIDHFLDRYVTSNKTGISNTIFTPTHRGYDLSSVGFIRQADVINLHWVADFQSPASICSLLALRKPVVWTLHDQWPFTGGCHYSAGCDGYGADCSECPQLAKDPFKLPAAVLKDKQAVLKDARITIVTPSRWLANCVKESSLFKNFRAEVIPYGLDTDIFTPVPKTAAKQMMGFDPQEVIILFGAVNISEMRKGGRELLAAMNYCNAYSAFKDLVDKGLVRFVCFGSGHELFVESGMPVVSLGYLDSIERTSLAYSAADMFLLPSLEDNLPCTMLEAMSCGTPVVAFSSGGIPDAVVDGVTGRLVETGNVSGLAEAIVSLAMDQHQCDAMAQACRRTALQSFALHIQAQRYLDLYEDLIRTNKARPELCKPTYKRAAVPAKRDDAMVRVETVMGVHLQASFQELSKLLEASELDRAARLEVINSLSEQLAESELDRAARLEVINSLSEQLAESELDRAARLEVINSLSRQLEESDAKFKRLIDFWPAGIVWKLLQLRRNAE